MKQVQVAGRGLACSLGLDVTQALAALCNSASDPSRYQLPGAIGSGYPFYSIPFRAQTWDERARLLVQRVASEAGAAQARRGILFLASSSLDIGAAEQGTASMDFDAFADTVAGWLDWEGPVYLVSTACTSGLNALLAARAMLHEGVAEDALVLGLELENRVTLGGFAALQLLSPGSCRPFGAGRNGLVLGEAVAALRLSLRELGTWRLAGGANVVDGSQPTGASVDAVATMYRRALGDAGHEAQSIDLIKVQAAGSPANDAVEAEALCDIFSPLPPLVSFKAAMGHTMGASGVAEIALLTACLENGVWPAQEDHIDPALGVRLARHVPAHARRILATILGFGGSHASVILERSE